MRIKYIRVIGEEDGYPVQSADAIIAEHSVPSRHEGLKDLHLAIVGIAGAVDLGAHLKGYQRRKRDRKRFQTV